MAKETIGEDPSVDVESLLVTTDLNSKPNNTIQALQAVNITYHITWPLQNIIREATPQSQAKAFGVYAAHQKRLKTALLLSANLSPVREAIISGLILCEQFGPMWDALMGGDSDSDSHLKADRALRRLQKELRSTVGFLAAGVRNVSRVGGETLLEVLAEQLELIVAR